MITNLTNIKFDLEEARAYFHSVEEQYPNLKYLVGDDIVDSDLHHVTNLYGYGIQSNLLDLTVPCPPYNVHRNGLADYRNTVLVYGFAQKIIDFFPNVRQLGISVHPPGTVINAHIDNDEFYKIHIPLYSNPESYFNFGEDKHIMQPGQVYLVDTRFMHSTSNTGTTNRVNIIFKLKRNTMKDVLALSGNL